jgi:hypothetical protein
MFWSDSAGHLRSVGWEPTPLHHPFCNLGKGNNQTGSGMAVAALSAGDNHEEVYWIHPEGSVQASMWQGNKGWSQYRGYDFGRPGQALTAYGGSITAAVELGRVIYVWWVGPVYLLKPNKTVNTVRHSSYENG